MEDLREFWTSDAFVYDSNHDGVPDNTRMTIQGVSESCHPVGLIDLTARLGLETSGLTMPEFATDDRKDTWKLQLELTTTEQAHCQLVVSEKAVKIVAQTEALLSDFLRWFAADWPHTFNGDQEVEAIIGIDYASEGYRTLDSSGALSHWKKLRTTTERAKSFQPTFQGLTDLWTTAGFYQAGRVDLNSQCDIGFDFHGQLSQHILEKACQLSARIGLHSTGIQFPLTNLKQPAELMFHIKTDPSQESATVRWQERDVVKTIDIFIEGNEQSVANAIAYLATSKPFEEGGSFGRWEKQQSTTQADPLILEKTWEDMGEKQRLINTVDDWLKDTRYPDSIEVTAFISEPLQVRDELCEMLTDRLFEHTDVAMVQLYSAFKPGYHWIEESILPVLRLMASEIDHITFSCKEEAGPQGAELPIRWIQELYPIDQLLAKELGIDSEQVVFELAGEQDKTYHMTVTSKTGGILHEADFDVPVVDMAYINSGKKVYPTTGFIQMEVDGEMINSKLMPTDRERFWRFFMTDILDELPAKLPLNEPGRGTQYPLFSRLTVDVEMSEEERKLGIKEERHSSLEALHEDIYFNVLDYFHYLGEKTTGQPMTSPGGVHPLMHVASGARPKATVKVYGFDVIQNDVVRTQSLTFHPRDLEPITCMLDIGGVTSSVDQDDWIAPNQLMVDGLTSHATHLWLGGVSYEGREIPVIDVFTPTEATFVSPHKLASYKPTILIETGHHPNEVSSMPAVIDLINRLEMSLLNQLNLVVIPCANQDGRALHQRLAEDNPEWKHHAARYNAVGLEYAHHRYQDTMFGEAEVVPRIVDRWLPDVSIDDHGIPSHEWVQPFAGYNSPPRFPVSYWIPNSLIYGIVKQLEGEAYQAHRDLLKDVVAKIAEKVSADPEVREANEDWANTYEKYGSQWLPDTFPIEKEASMMFYHWNTKVKPTSHELIARYPEWCSIELISEAADETVYDTALDRCVKAHQLFDLAVIETIAQCQNDRDNDDTDGRLMYRRHRPLKLASKNTSLKK